jgi:hypothetical protein
MAKLVVLLLTPRTYLPMEIFSLSKGFRLYKLLIKCESLLLLTPISEAYKSTGLTVLSNICIQFGAEQGILLNIFFNLKKAFLYQLTLPRHTHDTYSLQYIKRK